MNRAKERFVSLPNGSLALLNSCYDLFGTADVGMAGGARRLAIRAVRQGSEQVTERDEGFRALRDGGLGGCGSLGELRTELEKLLDAMPALEAAPPKLVRNAMRIDTPSARRLAGRASTRLAGRNFFC